MTSTPTTLREYVKSAKRSAIDKQDWVFEMLSKNQPTSTAIRTYARVPSYDSHMTGHIVNSEQSPSSILRQKMMLHSNIPGHQSHDGHVTITAPPPSVRGYHPAIKEEREWTMESATVAIQRAWRRYSVRQDSIIIIIIIIIDIIVYNIIHEGIYIYIYIILTLVLQCIAMYYYLYYTCT